MQLKRQSVEAWQNEKHYSKRIIPARTQSQDEKFSNQSTMLNTKVTTVVVCAQPRFLISHEEYPGTGARFLGRILKFF